MAQHDYNLANQTGAEFRADLNNALAAIATVNSGATEPSTTFAHQLWVDTANSLLKIRNAANTDWITFGVSISSSNVFTGNLTGDVTGNLTGNVTGNVTGDLTGNADTATTLATARTISLSGDVAGSASFDGSGDITITTTAQIDSIALGADTTGDYVQSISGGTGVTITGGTGESSTPVVAIGQAVAVTSDVTFNIVTATNEFIGDLEGGIRFNAKADGALSAGDVIYISGVSGDVPTVAQAKADDASKMPAFGLALSDANDNAALQVVTFGTIENLDTSGVSEGQILYVSTTAGAYTTTAPTGESSQIQNIGKVIRSHAAAGSIKVGGAGRSNATPNLDNGKIFIGNGSNQSATSTLDTSIVPENTNLYWTTARGESMFDTRLATKDTGDLAEGSNLYYTTARVNSDFDTRLATKDTGDLAEGSNLYYTTARVNSDFDTRLATKDTDDLTEGTTNLYYTSSRANADFDTRLATKSTTNLAEGTNLYYTDARFDTRLATKDTDDLTEGTNLYYTQARFDSAFSNKTTNDLTENTNLYYTDARANSAIDSRVTKTFVDNLGVIAGSVQADSVALGTDTTGNYIQTITGTANKITVTGSGSESADVTLTLPDDVQIADSLTVAGNLTVNGTLTSLDTTNLDIEDNLFQLNAGLTGSPVNDSGMLINRGNQDNGIFMWDESVDKFTLGLTTADGTSTGNITLNSLGTLVANIEGNVTGNVTGTVSSLSNHDTADLAEGTNLYYTDARADARVNLQTGANLDLSSKSTSDLSEGTNEYFTTARARSSISATGDISYNSSTGVISFTASAAPVTSVNTLTGAVVLDSDDISEGATNLYYTDARVQAVSINNVVEDTTPQLGGDLASNGNDILFADNDKAIFGAGSDLQIYHDGSNSYIVDSGTGDLLIRAENNLYLKRTNSDETYLSGVVNDAVTLYHNNNPKIATTISGIDVTGAATMDGLTVDTSTLVVDSANNRVGIGTTSPTDRLDVAAPNSQFRLTDTDDSTFTQFSSSGGKLAIRQDSTSADHVFLNASGNVGIGTASPSANLHVSGSGDKNIAVESTNTGAGANAGIKILSADGGDFIWQTGNATGNALRLYDLNAAAELMRIDSSGNVGIGVTSVNGAKLDVQGGVLVSGALTANQTDAGYLEYGSNILTIGSYGNTTGSGIVRFATGGGGDSGGQERMRIDSSGNLMVGKTSVGVGNAGIELRANNMAAVSRAGDNVLYLNRITNDGSILEFRKDNVVVGNIGVSGGNNPYFSSAVANHGGLMFSDGGSSTPQMNPISSGSTLVDNAMNIGSASYRFKDLYLAGTASIGNLTIAGSQGTDGQVLTSTGSGIAWEDASGGVAGIVSSADATAITIDSSENVIIGGSSSIGGARFTVDQNSGASIIGADAASGSGGYIQLLNSGTAKGLLGFGSNAGASSINNVALRSQSGALEFHTNGANERMRILPSGGITFNGDTATANALDDYEEGTWTPTTQGGTTGGFGSPTGTYIKIGKQVHAAFQFTTTGGVSGGLNYRVVEGLPFNMYQNDYVGMLGTVSAYNLSDYRAGAILQYSSSNSTEMFVFWKQTSSSGTIIRCLISYRSV